MIRRKIGWIILGAAAVVLRSLLAAQPEWIEQYYSRGIFLGIRWIIDYLLASWFPVPLIYLFFAVLVFWIVRGSRRLWKSPGSWANKGKEASISTLAFIGGGLFWFLFLWGFNYGRVPLEDSLGLSVRPLQAAELKEAFEQQTETIIRLRAQIPGSNDSALTRAFLPGQLERHLRRDLENWLQQQGFPTVGRVRARKLWPAGIFLCFNSSGLYFPFVGEGNVDVGVHPLQLPHIMAHEMGHGYGFGDEGTCNFLAFVACASSPDPAIAYAGQLDYWRTLAVNYRRQAPEDYQLRREALPAGIRADLEAINAALLRFPEIMPELRYHAYDAYLKTQGIEEGMLNYNRVVMLVKAWRDKSGNEK